MKLSTSFKTKINNYVSLNGKVATKKNFLLSTIQLNTILKAS